jgi:hypothetical protein
MSRLQELLSGAPGTTFEERLELSLLRAARTLLQGIAGAFPAAGAGTVILTASYWQIFGYSCLSAFIAALVSLLQNVAGILPGDQQK